MQLSIKIKLLPLFALMLIIGAFLLTGTQTASAIDITTGQSLTVADAWLTDGILNIAVTDSISGESKVMELTLSDYAQPGDEYVTIQATDSSGRLSNTFQFKNPYYTQDASLPQPESGKPITNGGEALTDADETAVTDETGLLVTDGDEPIPCTGEFVDSGETNPFTPDGTGTVIDNATDGDGKEFFNIETPDGSVFYLVIDRQRSKDNVYLLNAVTEQDLMALAKPGDGNASTAPDTMPGIPEPEPEPQTDEEPVTPVKPPEKSGSKGSIIIIIVAVIAVGGAGYYFKIVRPKQNGGIDDDDFDDDPESFDDDTEVDMENNYEEDETE